MPEEKEVKEEAPELLVVRELPTTQVRNAEGDNGKRYDLVTIEEAVTEILKLAREIKLAVA